VSASAFTLIVMALRLYVRHCLSFAKCVLVVVTPVALGTYVLNLLAASNSTKVIAFLHSRGLTAPKSITVHIPALAKASAPVVVSAALLIGPLTSILVLIVLSELYHKRRVRPLYCLRASWRFLPATIALYVMQGFGWLFSALVLAASIVGLALLAAAWTSSAAIPIAVSLSVALAAVFVVAIALLSLLVFAALTLVVVDRKPLLQALRLCSARMWARGARIRAVKHALLLGTFTGIVSIIIMSLLAALTSALHAPLVVSFATQVVVSLLSPVIVVVYAFSAVQLVTANEAATGA
jgi:hypothetical protein